VADAENILESDGVARYACKLLVKLEIDVCKPDTRLLSVPQEDIMD
jgi:hypothetical protein